jgi:hypothetical protein
MNFGFVLPFGDARFAAECAKEAESSGWNGFFVWEPVWGVDAWVSLTAAASVTKHINLGTMLTPLPVLSPWKLASETASLDNYCGGRLILSVGLGAVDTGFMNFGLPTDRKERAERLDEGLEVLTGLWEGQPFQFEGKYYHIQPTDFQVPPAPVQSPRIPIWVVGAWPSEKSMQRALQFDGLLPNFIGRSGKVEMGHPDPDVMKEMADYVRLHTDGRPFDIIMEGETDPSRLESLELLRTYASHGVTWWMEALWSAENQEEIISRIKAGPPLI